MSKAFSLALLCAAILFGQCKHTRYTADNLPDDWLRFGSGGGFTGVETTYTLLENGQLFQANSQGKGTTELPPCKRRDANKLFESAEKLGLLQLDFQHPGNTYQFMEFQDDGQSRRIAWGDREHPVDEKIKALYDQLIALTANRN